MQLKDYQERVIREVEQYLDKLDQEREAGNLRHASLDAWRDLHLGSYNEQQDGLGEDMPNFTIKVPTGGGKTLIATQVLGSIYRTILKDRRGAGLVLWVVPSQQIYRDTLRRLRDREDLYRVMLEHAISRRIELWEKTDIYRLTPTKLNECLNILMVQLASTNRETKEQLKFFRDSGGNIVQHFPPEDEPNLHKELKAEIPNLGMIEDDETTGRHLIETSIGNLVRICKPAVILDEGHKATSQLARQTIREFNASIVVELSATPHKDANILTRVSGQELLDEEMIKLPLNIATSGQKSWKDALTQARDKRKTLAKKAIEHATKSGFSELIRPIVLVQVERTGKDQRGKKSGGRLVIHSEDVKEYLTTRLGIADKAIAIKTSETDDIEGIDLDDPDCLIEWIITKAALQEGWDCPFAYILVSLNNTGSGQSMTQLIGRILRQPYQRRTEFDELNESYVYCLHRRASDIAREVKGALEKEGYEGDAASLIATGDGGSKVGRKMSRIRDRFSNLYSREFDGKIYLPHFCVNTNGEYEALDYFQHLMSKVDVDRFDYDSINWPLAEELKKANDRFYRISIGEELSREYETRSAPTETDEQVMAWLVASLPFDYLSFKRLGTIVKRVGEQLYEAELQLRDQMVLVKFVVRDHIQTFVIEQLNIQTKNAFEGLYNAGQLEFYLQCERCRFEIPPEIEVKATRRLLRDDNDEPKRSLFDYVDESKFNEYEKAVALCLDDDANVLWWYRNLVGAGNFAVQGYRREKVYPDFVVQDQGEEKPSHRVLVIESKGEHLRGGDDETTDTGYKRNLAEYFTRVGRQVTWQQLGEDFKDHIFRFQILDERSESGRDWKDELTDLLAAVD